jgi:hypothetical protein
MPGGEETGDGTTGADPDITPEPPDAPEKAR